MDKPRKNIFIIFLLCGCKFNKTKEVFLNLGYSNKEIKEIDKYLKKSDINYLSNHNYVENITEFIRYSIFDINNLDRYIAYRNKYYELDFYHIILYVNMNLDKDFYSDVKTITNPYDKLVLVNKYNKLPDDYSPNDLVLIDKRCSVKDDVYIRKEASKHLIDMCMDMISLNLDMKVISGYRNYDYQKTLYDEYVKKDGEYAAIKYSARPRFSEHETGLSIDVMGNNKNYTKFNETPEYRYILNNAHNYGFIIRYDNEFVTGYINEAWHLRYVGIKNAKKIKNDNITLDEYVYMNK